MIIVGGNKSPEVDEVQAEDSKVERVPEVNEEVENKTSTKFGTISMQEKTIPPSHSYPWEQALDRMQVYLFYV